MKKDIRFSERDGFDGKPTSVWLDTTTETSYQQLKEDITVDVAVVGGGIAGLLCAYLLLEEGLSVVVLEAGRIVEDVTAFTTAKITSEHGHMYRYLIKNFGESKAKMYADANQAGLRKIVQIILEKNIRCDLEKQSAYLYTEKDKNIEMLKREAQAARKLGLPARYVDKAPLDFIKGAVEFGSQAQFHPRKFLLALAEEIQKKGKIFEKSRVTELTEGEPNILSVGKNKVKAKKVVVTTHYPFYDKNRFYTKLYPHRSYVLGLKVGGEMPSGMYFSIDGEKKTLRSQRYFDKRILLVGGGTERAGVDADTLKYYKEIESYARERFQIRSIEYHWFTQDNHTPDRVPYIGKMPKAKNIYVATGFGGWGMTTSAVSAIIISDLIKGRVNPWSTIFEPSRRNISLRMITSFIGENSKTFKHVLERVLKRHPFDLPTGFKEGEGKIINLKGKKAAIYKDKDGKIYSVSPICTHMGCTVNWNPTEKTWDCPCHGSRFNYDGKVIHGPAQKDLKKEDI